MPTTNLGQSRERCSIAAGDGIAIGAHGHFGSRIQPNVQEMTGGDTVLILEG